MNPTTESTATPRVITPDVLYSGTTYTPRPGLRYEIAAGIVVTLREMPPALALVWDRVVENLVLLH